MSVCADVPVRFFQRLSGELCPVSEETLGASIPLSRPGAEPLCLRSVTFRTYLTAVESFVKRNSERLQNVIREIHPESSVTINRFDVISEKHGSDYHPARIVVETPDSAYSFVANVAVTERGRSRLTNEFSVLRLLEERYPGRSFLPRAYFLGEHQVTDCEGSIPVAMFLGEWLEGYHEFHHVQDPENGDLRLSLWDMDRGPTRLNSEQEREILRQAAFILTHYYDPLSFHEIFPWHHAAGDFVVLREGERLDVKLVTARQYAPRMEFAAKSPETQVQALLLFLANLTIRMRLDRCDGVRETVWAGEHCLEASLRGFADAMDEKVASGLCPSELWKTFIRTARDMPPDGLAELFASVAQAYAPDAPDVPVIHNHFVDHILGVYRGLRTLFSEKTQADLVE